MKKHFGWRWAAALLLLVVVLFGLGAWPGLRLAYAANRGTVALTRALAVVADGRYSRGDRMDDIYVPGAREIGAVGADAAAAAFALGAAAQMGPAGELRTHRLAQALALQGEFSPAARLLESSPSGPSIASALLALAAGEMEQGRATWRSLGLDAADGLALADRYFFDRYYGNAAALYATFLPADAGSSTAHAFQAAVAAIAAGRPDADPRLAALAAQDPAFAPLPVTDTLTIAGDQLRWLDAFPEYGIAPGSLLYEGDVPGDGVMLWSGAAVVLLDAAQRGAYCLTATLRNTPATGAELALQLDGQSLRQVTLEGAAASLTSVSAPVVLDAGPHFAGVAFLNDAFGDGVDRNAFIHSLSLRAATPGAACEQQP